MEFYATKNKIRWNTLAKQGHIQFLKNRHAKMQLLLLFCFRMEAEYKTWKNKIPCRSYENIFSESE